MNRYDYSPQNGKGDHLRKGADLDKYRDNFDKIDWSDVSVDPAVGEDHSFVCFLGCEEICEPCRIVMDPE